MSPFNAPQASDGQPVATFSWTLPMVGSGEGGAATLDDLVKQAVESFPSMFGTGETPGKAAKDSAGGSGPKTMIRAAFEALPAKERARKMSEGFTLVDPPAKKVERPKLGPKEMLVSAFNALPPKERAAKMKEGFTLVD
jgi:hypothetical protein